MNEALKAYIIKNKLTLQEVADRTGLKTPSTVCQHLRGDRRISAESALAYNKGLGIPLSDLRPDLWEPAMFSYFQQDDSQNVAASNASKGE